MKISMLENTSHTADHHVTTLRLEFVHECLQQILPKMDFIQLPASLSSLLRIAFTSKLQITHIFGITLYEEYDAEKHS